MGWGATPKGAEGNIIADPSYDELAQDSAPALDPTWNVSPNPNAPSKRPAPSSSEVAPDRKADHVDSALASKDDQDFANRHTMTISSRRPMTK